MRGRDREGAEKGALQACQAILTTHMVVSMNNSLDITTERGYTFNTMLRHMLEMMVERK